MGRFAGLNPTMRPSRVGGGSTNVAGEAAYKDAVPPVEDGGNDVALAAAPSRLSDARKQAMRGTSLKQEEIVALLQAVRAKVADEARIQDIPVTDTEAMQALARTIAEQHGRAVGLNVAQHSELVREVLAHIGGGYGPLSQLLTIPVLEDIQVNAHDEVWISVKGRPRERRTEVFFRDDDEVVALVQRLAAEAHRPFNFSEPILDAKLPNGNRINALLGVEQGGVSLRGTAISIRLVKSTKAEAVTVDKMQGEGMLPKRSVYYGYFGSSGETGLYDPDMDVAEFLRLCVRNHISMLFSGPTGSGKTTLMNAFLSELPDLVSPTIRVATAEDVGELTDFVPNIVRLQTRRANSEGKGLVTMEDLIGACLRQHPDIIVVGEVRLLEGAAYVLAVNSGHAGSMTSIHAQSPRAAMLRLHGLLRSNTRFDDKTCRDFMKAIEIIVQVGQDSRKGNQRSILQVASVDGEDSDGNYIITPLYEWQQGYFRPTGARPAWAPKLSGVSVV